MTGKNRKKQQTKAENEKERQIREYQKLLTEASRRHSDLSSKIRGLELSNAELMEQKAHLIRMLESSDKHCEVLISKMQAMESLCAQQMEANSGSYDGAV